MAQQKKTAKHFEVLVAPGRYPDGGGLYLVIIGGSRTWMFRYKRQGKGHWMGIGPDSLISLAKARDAVIDAKRLLLDGIDPIAKKSAPMPPRKPCRQPLPKPLPPWRVNTSRPIKPDGRMPTTGTNGRLP